LRINKQTKKTPAADSGLPIVAVQCSTDSFVVNQTLVLRINICGKNRHLRQAANRKRSCWDDNTKLKHFEIGQIDIENYNGI